MYNRVFSVVLIGKRGESVRVEGEGFGKSG